MYDLDSSLYMQAGRNIKDYAAPSDVIQSS